MANERLNQLLKNAVVCFREGRSPFSSDELAKQNVTAGECYELSQAIAKAVEFATPSECGERLGELLVGVPSISPNASMGMMEIALELKKRAIIEEDPEIRKHLDKFGMALMIVCRYSKIHQRAVIDALENLVKKEKAR